MKKMTFRKFEEMINKAKGYGLSEDDALDLVSEILDMSGVEFASLDEDDSFLEAIFKLSEFIG